MKKVLKLSLFLSTLALLTACSNIKSTSLVGEYRSENEQVTMTVSSSGIISFDKGVKSSEIKAGTIEEALTKRSVYEGSTGSGTTTSKTTEIDSLGGDLPAWDLTTDKPQTYEKNDKIRVRITTQQNGGGQTTTTENYVDVSRKFEFTKDGEKIKCKVNVKGIDTTKGMFGKDGEITFVK